MKNNTHFNYLKSFNYMEFFTKKTYQYFEPLLKLYMSWKNKSNNINSLMRHDIYIMDNQVRLVLIDDEFKKMLLREDRLRHVSLSDELIEQPRFTNHLNIVEKSFVDRMAKVLVAA